MELQERVVRELRGSLFPIPSRLVARRIKDKPASVNGALRALRRAGKVEQDRTLAERHKIHGRIVRVSPWRLVVLAVLACSTLGGCVTSGDLQFLSDELRDVEAAVTDVRSVLNDFEATDADVSGAVDGLGSAISGLGASLEEVKSQVTARTVEAIGDGKDLAAELGIPGAITALGMFLLHLLRNGTRRRELEHVKDQATASGAGQ